MALLGSRAAKKSREDRRVVRESVSNDARAIVERGGGSEEEQRRAGRLAGKQYDEYHMKAAAARSYQGFYAEHGTEAAGVLGAVAVVAGALNPYAGAALAAAAAAAKVQAAQESRLREIRLEDAGELAGLLDRFGADRAAASEPGPGDETSEIGAGAEVVAGSGDPGATSERPGLALGRWAAAWAELRAAGERAKSALMTKIQTWRAAQ
jgi:hypothetical protein